MKFLSRFFVKRRRWCKEHPPSKLHHGGNRRQLLTHEPSCCSTTQDETGSSTQEDREDFVVPSWKAGRFSTAGADYDLCEATASHNFFQSFLYIIALARQTKTHRGTPINTQRTSYWTELRGNLIGGRRRRMRTTTTAAASGKNRPPLLVRPLPPKKRRRLHPQAGGGFEIQACKRGIRVARFGAMKDGGSTTMMAIGTKRRNPYRRPSKRSW